MPHMWGIEVKQKQNHSKNFKCKHHKNLEKYRKPRIQRKNKFGDFNLKSREKINTHWKAKPTKPKSEARK